MHCPSLEIKYAKFLNSFNIKEVLEANNNNYQKTLESISHVFHMWTEMVIEKTENSDEEIVDIVAEQLKDILNLERKLKDDLLDAWIDK